MNPQISVPITYVIRIQDQAGTVPWRFFSYAFRIESRKVLSRGILIPTYLGKREREGDKTQFRFSGRLLRLRLNLSSDNYLMRKSRKKVCPPFQKRDTNLGSFKDVEKKNKAFCGKKKNVGIY